MVIYGRLACVEMNQRCLKRRMTQNWRVSKRLLAAVLLVVLLLQLNSNNVCEAFTLLSSRSNRYFQETHIVPPLERLDEYPYVDTDLQYAEHCLRVTYTNDPKVVSEWIAQHVTMSGCILGFDTESVPSFRTTKSKFPGPATVQLSTTTDCLVVHLAKKSGRKSKACLPILQTILRDKRIILAGCSIDDDMIELRQDYPNLVGTSRLELSGIGAMRGETLGLKKLCRHILGLDLPKSKKLTTSNWANVPLSDKQLAYCARDAWVGAAIADKLQTLDPELFGTEALVQRLESQRSLRDLANRRKRRKRAKRLLHSLLAPNSVRREKDGEPAFVTKKVPSWKMKVVQELKSMMKENGPERAPVYDLAVFSLAGGGAGNFTA